MKIRYTTNKKDYQNRVLHRKALQNTYSFGRLYPLEKDIGELEFPYRFFNKNLEKIIRLKNRHQTISNWIIKTNAIQRMTPLGSKKSFSRFLNVL